MEPPNEFEPLRGRMIVHRPTILAHHAHLAAIGIALCAAAIRTRTSYRIAVGTALVALATIALQVSIYPTIG